MSKSTATHKGLIVASLLSAAVMLIDGYDLQVMALLVPAMVDSWGVTASSFSLAQSAPLLGLGIGAAFIAPFGDRYGRRLIIIIAFGILTLAVLGSTFSSGMTSLSIWRLLTGIALGATLPNVSALMAELAPANRRAGLLTLISCAISMGAMGSGFIVPKLVTAFGWPSAFVFSASISIVIWLALLWRLPESPTFKKQALVKADKKPSSSIKEIFLQVLSKEYRIKTLALWGLFVGNAFVLYMLTSWIPSILTERGWSLDQASAAIAYMQLGGLIGGLSIAMLMDKWKPTHALIVAYIMAAICLLLFKSVPDTITNWSILFALVGAGIAGVHLTLNAVASTVYPATILSSGIGFTIAIMRVGAIAGPLIGGFLVAQQMSAESFFSLLVAPIVMCILCVFGLSLNVAMDNDE